MLPFYVFQLKRRHYMKTFLIMTLLFINHQTAIASEGPISGGGGGGVVFQSLAIGKIVSDIHTRKEIGTKYFPSGGAFLKSIEWKSWKSGNSVYVIKNSADCIVEVEATAADDSGMTYTTAWHELVCPH